MSQPGPHMRHTFTTKQWLPYPPELVFAFFANPENLPRLMPKWQRARIEEALFTAPPLRPPNAPRYPGIAAGNGTKLTIGIRPFPFAPFRIPWEAEIENFQWNQGFCDIQLRGPFKYWRHCHTVTAEPSPEHPGQQGTTLRDEVEYELPLDLLNPIARQALAYTFRYRQRQTAHLLTLMTGRPQ